MAHVFDLYIDESGNFRETEKARHNQGFASQLAGILTPQGKLTRDEADKIIRIAYKKAGYSPPGEQVHSKDLKPGAKYDRAITTLAEKVREKGWQPVRLVNQEGINYGDRETNYVNMVAELVLRIFQRKSLECYDNVTINLYYASVKLGEDDSGNPIFLEKELYRNELESYLAFAAVRQGLAKEYQYWKIGKCKYGSAKKKRELQLCDLLSNASHNDYAKCGENTKKILQDTFKHYDYSMVVYLTLEQCDLFLQNGSLGLAIRTLAERLVQEDQGENIQQGASERLQSIIGILANWTATERNNQLTSLINWIEQRINLQRSLDLGCQLVQWLQTEIYQPLVTRLEDKKQTLDWFNYALHFWALTAYNHQGNLIAGRREAHQLEKLIPSLAGQWEHVTLLMKGLVAEGVHRIDCLEYNQTATKMELVANYYREVSSLFTVAFPDIFPETVRSHSRGEALGTWLQAEIYAGATESHCLNKARELSNECIAEFTTPSDKARQYQYRCHLETLAGDFGTAREYLAKSLGMEDICHSEIAQEINKLEGIPQGFALLHWLRLGTTAHLDNNTAEWSEFIKAFQQAKLQHNSWCQGKELDDYPTHGILRRMTLIEAIEGKATIAALGRLRNLAPISQRKLILALIQCAAYAEVAGFWWETNNELARKKLDSQERDNPGLKQLLEILKRKTGNLFPQVEQLTQSWLTIIEEILNNQINDTEVKPRLLKLGREISH